MEPFSLAVGIGLAIGVGLIADSVFSFFYAIGRRVFRLTKWGRLQALGPGGKDQITNRNSEEVILGLANIPWRLLYAGAAFAGLILLVFLGSSLSAVRLVFLALPALVWLAKKYLIQQRKRFMTGQIRQLLIDVRLHMSLQGSLLLGLESVAKTTVETTAVYQRLQKRLQGSSARNGLDVLNQLAGDLNSVQLSRVAQRVQATQQSGGITDVDQAIASVIEDLNEEISYQSEEQMQRLPMRITLLAMPLLLGPIVILLFYPLVDRILKSLAGVSIGGGF